MDGKQEDKPVKPPQLWLPPEGMPMLNGMPLIIGFVQPLVFSYDSPAKPPEGMVQLGSHLLSAAALERYTMAERMLQTAAQFNNAPKGLLLISTEKDMFEVEFTAVCLKFARLPAATRFRAIVEKWSYDQIVRETHQ
jgi:hypothetical protein